MVTLIALSSQFTSAVLDRFPRLPDPGSNAVRKWSFSGTHVERNGHSTLHLFTNCIQFRPVCFDFRIVSENTGSLYNNRVNLPDKNTEMFAIGFNLDSDRINPHVNVFTMKSTSKARILWVLRCLPGEKFRNTSERDAHYKSPRLDRGQGPQTTPSWAGNRKHNLCASPLVERGSRDGLCLVTSSFCP